MNLPESGEVELNKDGSVSKMRAHKGNMPVSLPQDKLCPYCSARFTRTTHLTRHIKTHATQRDYQCPTCPASFTRSDLLARHRKICQDPNRPGRLRSCNLCIEQKVKCDRKIPSCSRCQARGKPCVFATGPRKKSRHVEVATMSNVSQNAASSSSTLPQSPHESVTPAEPPLDLESLNKELDAASAESNIAASLPLPVDSHLSPHYDNDAFQPLFADVFDPGTENAISPPKEAFPLPFPVLEEIPRHSTSLNQPWFQELIAYEQRPLLEEMARQKLVEDFFTQQLQSADPKHYLYLFFNAWTLQLPVVHSATFKLEDKPLFLTKCMKACGAVFVRTRKASNYIKEALGIAREGLTMAFAQTSIEPSTQVYLIIAVVLLQTLGLFNEKAEERIASQMYHSLIVAMIRRTQLISRTRDWRPDPLSESPWQDWAFYEMTKRALLLSYLHDCCQSIYFGLPPSYLPQEVSLRLPCDERLWQAQNAEEWRSVLVTLNTSNPSQIPHECLAGHPLNSAFSNMVQLRSDYLPVPNLSPFAHFILIHALLRDLFAACLERVEPKSFYEPGDKNAPHQTILTTQYAMHNWLQSWIASSAPIRTPFDELPLAENPLPFYWLAQIGILAHQEGLPPFDSAANATGEVRFKIMKRWLRRIRTFLVEGDNQTTVFWDELMKLRLQNWQAEFELDGGGDDDGLLGFFPSLA
ncbi:Fungal-trans domain-containing protein [Mycena indigotica]|uniref:Fungal-trans domain-containing protein n=1 Tax=Mycena indigotica TaxID=2126181 RepID=A0A8H6W6P8_9AGAR|nr:Fungal-trans domain-containing protein [Mycena indigotica]KAF7306857.1 Fungal-trans domain-containing protein [Mycena indigotica]